MEDGSVVKVVDNGEVVFVSGVDRIALNKSGEKRAFGADIDFWLQLFCVSEERKAGVYTAQLKEGVLSTRDDEGNQFTLCSDGGIHTKIAVSLNLADARDEEQFNRPSTPSFHEKEFIEEENKFLPPPATWIPPRLFTIYHDSTGYELLCKEQVDNYIRLKEEDRDCVKVIDEEVPNLHNCVSVSFISKLVGLQEKKVIEAGKLLTPFLMLLFFPSFV